MAGQVVRVFCPVTRAVQHLPSADLDESGRDEDASVVVGRIPVHAVVRDVGDGFHLGREGLSDPFEAELPPAVRHEHEMAGPGRVGLRFGLFLDGGVSFRYGKAHAQSVALPCLFRVYESAFARYPHGEGGEISEQQQGGESGRGHTPEGCVFAVAVPDPEPRKEPPECLDGPPENGSRGHDEPASRFGEIVGEETECQSAHTPEHAVQKVSAGFGERGGLLLCDGTSVYGGSAVGIPDRIRPREPVCGLVEVG